MNGLRHLSGAIARSMPTGLPRKSWNSYASFLLDKDLFDGIQPDPVPVSRAGDPIRPLHSYEVKRAALRVVVCTGRICGLSGLRVWGAAHNTQRRIVDHQLHGRRCHCDAATYDLKADLGDRLKTGRDGEPK